MVGEDLVATEAKTDMVDLVTAAVVASARVRGSAVEGRVARVVKVAVVAEIPALETEVVARARAGWAQEVEATSDAAMPEAGAKVLAGRAREAAEAAEEVVMVLDMMAVSTAASLDLVMLAVVVVAAMGAAKDAGAGVAAAGSDAVMAGPVAEAAARATAVQAAAKDLAVGMELVTVVDEVARLVVG